MSFAQKFEYRSLGMRATFPSLAREVRGYFDRGGSSFQVSAFSIQRGLIPHGGDAETKPVELVTEETLG
jgi:hypothetical protein